MQYYMYEVCDAGARWGAADGADKGHEALMVRMFLVKYGDALSQRTRSWRTYYTVELLFIERTSKADLSQLVLQLSMHGEDMALWTSGSRYFRAE